MPIPDKVPDTGRKRRGNSCGAPPFGCPNQRVIIINDLSLYVSRAGTKSHAECVEEVASGSLLVRGEFP